MSQADLSRRRLLTGRPPSEMAPPRPPWAETARFVEACTRCGDCGRACPEAIVVAGSGGFPRLDFRRGGCTFCGACADACRQPVFGSRDGRPWFLVARLSERCLARSGVVCQSCGDACEPRAIRFRPALRTAAQPELDAGACTGCGACVSACPADAITVEMPRHG